MGIVSGGAKALGSVADAIGLDWVGGAAGLTGLATTPVVISLGVPEDYPSPTGPFPAYHNGTITLNVPNNSKEFGEIAVNMAQNSLAMVELAIALQTIVSPKGGISIKDELDPYQFDLNDTVQDIFSKYYSQSPKVSIEEKTRLYNLIDPRKEVQSLGAIFDECVFEEMKETYNT